MKLNRKLILILSLLVSIAMVTTGTLAYLSDTDADVNVMTLGNVHIVQNEQEWNAGKTALQAFTNDKPIYPYVGEQGWENTTDEDGAYRRLTMANVVDKYVSVTNTGNSDAFVRTIIAVEMGEYADLAEYIDNIIGLSTNAVDGDEFSFPETWSWSDPIVAEINNSNYMVLTATLETALAPWETTIPSLLQVYMNKDCGNTETAKVDGNDNDKLDILVLSQAVQTAGFATAAQALDAAFAPVDAASVAQWLGDITEEDVGSPGDDWVDNNPPMNVTKVHNEDELEAALAQGGYIMFANSFDATKTFNMDADDVVDGDGFTLTHKGGRGVVAFNPTGGTIKNLSITGTGLPGSYAIGSIQFAGTTLTDDLFLENVTIKNTMQSLDMDANGNSVHVNNCEIYSLIQIANAVDSIFTDCHFTCTVNTFTKETLILLMGDMTFNDCHFEETVNFYLDSTRFSGTLNFNGCTYGNNGVEDRPFEKSVGFFSWWMNPSNVVGHKGTFGAGKPANISFTCIVDGTTVWEATNN